MIIEGQGPDGLPKTARLDADGNLLTSGGGGGGGDASATNQVITHAKIDTLDASVNGVASDLDAALRLTPLPTTSALATTATATLSNVSASASNKTLLASNTSRKRIVIYNDSTAILYVKFGATASSTSFTYLLNGGETYESPSQPTYTGQIDGIWASATGAARITEMT